MAAALRMRRHAGMRLDEAICVYDLAELIGIEVRFAEIPSLEGMYCPDFGPAIILSSLRPPGRRTYTCAHELGHHSSGDGTQTEVLAKNSSQINQEPREFAAECFAGALLMPNMAVQRAFSLRGWKTPVCSPAQVYAIANYFGVGYSTLVHHMTSGLRIMSRTYASKLLKFSMKQARAQAIGWDSQVPVWVVDSHWTGRAIDVEVGDLILVYGRTDLEGSSMLPVKDTQRGILLRAHEPGVSRIADSSDWHLYVRVSRQGFVGRSIFRHLEE